MDLLETSCPARPLDAPSAACHSHRSSAERSRGFCNLLRELQLILGALKP
jgi:hypothetical protein